MKNIRYLVLGIIFGVVLYKSEVISWFRIQEMFRFQSFHMYGVIGSAVIIGAISILIIKRLKIKTINSTPISIPDKKLNKGNVFGGIIFGLGWALTGACPGPLYALVGGGYWVILPALLSAIMGTWVYGRLQNFLPH